MGERRAPETRLGSPQGRFLNYHPPTIPLWSPTKIDSYIVPFRLANYDIRNSRSNVEEEEEEEQVFIRKFIFERGISKRRRRRRGEQTRKKFSAPGRIYNVWRGMGIGCDPFWGEGRVGGGWYSFKFTVVRLFSVVRGHAKNFSPGRSNKISVETAKRGRGGGEKKWGGGGRGGEDAAISKHSRLWYYWFPFKPPHCPPPPPLFHQTVHIARVYIVDTFYTTVFILRKFNISPTRERIIRRFG